MNIKFFRVLVFGIITSSIFLSITLTSKSGESNTTEPDAATYRRLYFAKVTSSLAMNTAVLTRMDQGDYQTAKKVMLLRLKSDLEQMNRETNYPWGEQDKKAKTLAEQYLKQGDKK